MKTYTIQGPVWDDDLQCKLGDIFIGFIRVENDGWRCYSTTNQSESWKPLCGHAMDWVENEALTRLGAIENDQ